MGAYNPIRIQSMTNTNTLDTIATVNQSVQLIEAGCEYVRISTPGIKEAENLKKIKKELNARGFYNPLIADIHFNPAVAEIAARIADKIRINPGNYIDKKSLQKSNYSDLEYQEELEKLFQKTKPLIEICKEYGTAMRIGVNHGSLSERIMSRYGDTPLGMVESALEFVRICENLDYKNLVLSMKASNIKVMVYAYRLLVNRMMQQQMNYPLHLGVTEAGSGIDGRVKSAAGIGALLEDGIGDTIRVSLTEEPVAEIPVALEIIGNYSGRMNHFFIEPVADIPGNPFDYHQRITHEVNGIGASNLPVVIVDKEEKTALKADLIFDSFTSEIFFRSEPEEKRNYYKNVSEYFSRKRLESHSFFLEIHSDEFTEKGLQKISNIENAVFVLTSLNKHWASDIRAMIYKLWLAGIKNPVIIKKLFEKSESLELIAAADFAVLLVDGLCNGIWISKDSSETKEIEDLSFSILQATGSRISQTEYVSCPTCARTSYNIIDTVEKIKAYTSHLKGLKIAIMGCVVNGPGEMADANYGYVGNGLGKINLYKGKTLVKRNIEESDALDELIKLLKENGDWKDEPLKNQ